MPAATPRPLRVAHVTTEAGFSGGEAQVFLLMDGLRKRGHHNLLLCPAASRSEAEARRRGLESRQVPAGSEWRPGNVRAVRAALEEVAPDLVHLHTGRANWLGGLAARRLGLPALTTRRMDRRVKRGPRTRWLYGRLVRRVAAISPAVARRLREGGVPEAMIRMIPSAIDPDALHPQQGRETVRAAEGIEADAPLLLVAANLVRRKGVDVLVEALAGLAGEALHPALWIAGDGPERGALASLVKARSLEGQVRFLGRRGDVPDLLAACDVFVLPSRLEGLGVAALEAMAAGRPVVASRVGGLGEVVGHERTGLLVPPEDPGALRVALSRLLREPALGRRLGAAGPGRVAEGHLASQMTAAYEALYLEILGERGTP